MNPIQLFDSKTYNFSRLVSQYHSILSLSNINKIKIKIAIRPVMLFVFPLKVDVLFSISELLQHCNLMILR